MKTSSTHPRDLFRSPRCDTDESTQDMTDTSDTSDRYHDLPTLRKPSLDAPTRITIPICSHLADTTIDQNTTEELPTSQCQALAGGEEIILLDSDDMRMITYFTFNGKD